MAPPFSRPTCHFLVAHTLLRDKLSCSHAALALRASPLTVKLQDTIMLNNGQNGRPCGRGADTLSQKAV